MEELVRSGFRPLNLPPKSERERERHHAHVSAILTEHRIDSAVIAKDAERRALDALWRTELMTSPRLELTDQMRRLWAEYGLPSQFVRSVLWPWNWDHNSPSCPTSSLSGSFKSLIELDVTRTLPFLGFKNDSKKIEKCIRLLDEFAAHHPLVGYTQGMSYIAVRLMMEMDWNSDKSSVCLKKFVIDSPTVACMYSLDLGRINASVRYILDSIAWDNIAELWMYLTHTIRFEPIDWFFLEWILTIYVKNFSVKISGFIFDLFFLQGDVVLYKAAIAVLVLMKDRLMGQDVEGVRALLARAGDCVADSEIFVKTYHEVHVSTPLDRVLESRVLFPD
jgi:hypothetical protein